MTGTAHDTKYLYTEIHNFTIMSEKSSESDTIQLFMTSHHAPY